MIPDGRWCGVGIPQLRFYLTGRIIVEGRELLDQSQLPGRQGRLALVYLVAHRHRPVRVDELAAALWGDELPPSWEPSLRAIVSKLRSRLDGVGAHGLRREAGCFHVLVGDAWVDLEAAANALDRAEGAWRRGDVDTAWSEATVAASITQRSLLDGEDLPWVDGIRRELEQRAIRALDVLSQVHLARGDHALAAASARRMIALAPFREMGYQLLMLADTGAGDPAEALRTYRRLTVLLAEELGTAPTPATQELFERILTSGPPRSRERVRGGE